MGKYSIIEILCSKLLGNCEKAPYMKLPLNYVACWSNEEKVAYVLSSNYKIVNYSPGQNSNLANFGRIVTFNYHRLVLLSNLVDSEYINLRQYLINMKSMTLIINIFM